MKIKVTNILYAFVVLGVGLSVFNFFNLRSLWLDEAMLALNIIKPSNELFQPLDYNQVAPIGFLLIEYLFGNLFGKTDWSLRIFPMLSYFVSIYLIFITSLKIIKDKKFALFCTAFFSLSYSIIFYSSEVKQYMSDITVCLVILYATLHFTDKNNKKLWLFALVGIITIWFSNISIILLFSYGVYFLFKTYTSKDKNSRNTLLVLASWIVSFIVYYVLFIHQHSTRVSMVQFWKEAGAFLPQNVFSVEFYEVLSENLKEFYDLMGHHFFNAYIPLLILGLFYLAKFKKNILYLLLSPLFVHLLLSYFTLYPFSTRLILYLYPILILIIVSGIYYLFSFLKNNKLHYLFYILPLLLVLNLIVLVTKGFPIEREEIKKSLSFMDSKIQKEDNIYVYYSAYHPFLFYKDNYPQLSKIDTKNIHVSPSFREEWKGYESLILDLNDRVWLVFSHTYWKKKNGVSEEEYILNLFRKNGYEIKEKKNYTDSSVYFASKK